MKKPKNISMSKPVFDENSTNLLQLNKLVAYKTAR
jgi:hypothetical protein